jgi:hypothetical protein
MKDTYRLLFGVWFKNLSAQNKLYNTKPLNYSAVRFVLQWILVKVWLFFVKNVEMYLKDFSFLGVIIF